MLSGIRRTASGCAIGVAVAAALAVASPLPSAAASISDSGSGTGRFDFVKHGATPGPPPCVQLTGTYTDTGHTGTFSDGRRTYRGSVKLTAKYVTYANPDGTFLDPQCTRPGPGKVLFATIRGGSGSNSVSCNYTSGTFSRTGFPAFTITVNGSCSVDQGSLLSDPGEVWNGQFVTCFGVGAGPPSACTTSETL